MTLDEDTRAIVIADNGLMNLYLRVNHIPAHGEWRIVNIEVYSSFPGANEGKNTDLVADDVVFETLPHATKMAIWAKLDEVVHQRREALNRVRMMRASLERKITADAQ